MELVGFHGVSELLLASVDPFLAVEAAADWSFLRFAVFVLVYPILLRTEPAVKFGAGLAVVANIFEIELGSITRTSFTILRVKGRLN